MAHKLTPAEALRYDRHLRLAGVGTEGQLALRNTSVLLVGLGGLGSPIGLYLTAAGIGRLGIADFDRVEETNLQRQILYGTEDVGKLKTDAARRRLYDLNPHVEIDVIPHRLTTGNARQVIGGYDIVADGSDNFATRYLVNDACVLTDTPNVYGSISQFEGQVAIFASPGGPCYRCLFDHPPPPDTVPSCSEGGVLGVLPGLVGTIQATEVLKLALGLGDPLIGKLLLIDALGMQFHTLAISKNPDCPVCGASPTIRELIDYEAFCGMSHEEARTNDSNVPEITASELKALLEIGEAPLILDVRSLEEYETANMGGMHVPLPRLLDRLSEFDAHRDDDMIVVQCRSGSRSAKAVALLHEAGFANAVNLKGGLLAWMQASDA